MSNSLKLKTMSLVQAGHIFVNNVAYAIKHNGLSDSEAAYISDLSEQTIKRIRKAKANRSTYRPMLSTVVKLSQVIGVTTEELITKKYWTEQDTLRLGSR